MITSARSDRRSSPGPRFSALLGLVLFAAPVAAQSAAYVANLGSDTVSIVDVATQSVVATVAVGNDPDGVAATPDGTRVYVSNFLSDNVSVIDSGTNSVTTTIDVGTGPVGLAVTPDGEFVYVTNRGANTVSVVAVATNALVTTIPVGAGPNAVAITPDGTAAYVTNSFTNSPGTVSVIDLRNKAVTATVEVYRTPNRVAITPDGRFAYVANFRSWNIAVIDTGSNTVIATVPLLGRPSGVVVNPNGASVYVVTLGGTVEVIETTTSSVTNVIPVGANPYGIATTHNGGTSFVANFASGSISVVDLGEEVSGSTVAVGDKPFAVAVTCTGSSCNEPPVTPRPTRTATATWTASPTPTITSTQPPTPTPTPTRPPIRLEIAPVAALPGQLAPLSVTLRTGGNAVSATQNDVSFDPNTPIATQADGRPDCAVNPVINKGATTFAFEPAGCTPEFDCLSVRALVIAFDNVDTIPDGSVLYTCRLRIPADVPPGTVDITSTLVSGSDPAANDLPGETTGSQVVVGTPPGATPIPTHTAPPHSPTPTPTASFTPTATVDPATLVAVHVGSASGTAGQRVQFAVSIDTKGYDISGIQHDLAFDPQIAVAARANGRPDCAVNPAINKSATGFLFHPVGCTPNTDCQGFRALVLATDNVDPIPDGSVLYTCNVDIPSNAAHGTHPLEISGTIASSPEGVQVPSTGTDGEIVITGPASQGIQSQTGATAGTSGGCATTQPTEAAAPLLAGTFLLGLWRRQARRGPRR